MFTLITKLLSLDISAKLLFSVESVISKSNPDESICILFECLHVLYVQGLYEQDWSTHFSFLVPWGFHLNQTPGNENLNKTKDLRLSLPIANLGKTVNILSYPTMNKIITVS